MDGGGLLAQLFAQRQHRRLEGSEGRVQVQHHPGVALIQLLLLVGVAEDSEERALHAQGWLDDVGDVPDVLLRVEVTQILAGGVDMLGQIVIRPIRHAPELAPAEGEAELEVRCGLGVEAQLLGIVVPEPQVFILHAQGQQEVVAVGTPVIEPLKVGARLAEELQLHLFELTDPEDEVARGDLVAEGFADLTNAEWDLPAAGPLNVGKVHEDALGRLGPQVHRVLRVLGDALEGLEHQVELPDVREVVLAAGGAGDVVCLDELLHLRLREGVQGLFQGHAALVGPVLDELVGTEPLLALTAVHKGIGEAAQVPRGLPGHGVHQNGRVQAHVVGALLDKLLPPGLLDVVLQLHAQRTVVPGVGKTAVDLAARKNKASAFAQRNQFIHRQFAHIALLFLPWAQYTFPLYAGSLICQGKRRTHKMAGKYVL